MSRKFKILLTTHRSRLHSGSTFQLYLLARELIKRGHCVHALFKGDRSQGPHPSLKPLQDAGVKLELVQFTIMKYKHTIPELWWLHRYLLAGQFDVVNSFGGTDLSHLMISGSGIFIPALIAYRGLAEPLDPLNSIKYRLPKVRKIIANSEAVKQIAARTGHIRPEKIVVIYGGFDEARFRPEISGAGVRKEFKIADSAPVAIIIAHLKFNKEHRKGGYYFLQAAEKVLEQRPDSRFLLVGKVDRDGFVRNASERLKQACILTGFRNDIPELLAASNLLVNASLSEGMAGVLREALAMAKPVVATEIDGTPELVRHGETGLLVPPRDPEAMARAVIQLFNHRAEADSMGARGRQLVLELCRNQPRVDRYEQIYQEEYERATAKPHPWLHRRFWERRNSE
jgi:glycosyltransferase involved in cell wall biosynthesis